MGSIGLDGRAVALILCTICLFTGGFAEPAEAELPPMKPIGGDPDEPSFAASTGNSSHCETSSGFSYSAACRAAQGEDLKLREERNILLRTDTALRFDGKVSAPVGRLLK